MFLQALEQRNLTLNKKKSVENKTSINILGYYVGSGLIKPDEERLKHLQECSPLTNVHSLRRVVGMFTYYAKSIPNFSDKIQPLVNANAFQLSKPARDTFKLLNKEREGAALQSIDESRPFVVESDASEVAIFATLNQGGRPVAFTWRTLQSGELHYPPIQKEATAIIEAVRK